MFEVWKHKNLCLTALIAIALAISAALFINSGSAHGATITDVKPGVPVSLRIPDTDLLIKGCVASNSLVTIFDDGTTVGSVTSDTNGQYSRLLTAQTPTIHHIETFFEDTNGTRSTKTSNTIALPAKTLTTLTVNPAPTAISSPDPVTAGTNLSLSGYTCPNATVKVTIDGVTTLTVAADSNGLWQITFNSINYGIGTHVYNVSSAKSGYTSAESQTYQFQVVASQGSADVVVNKDEIPPPVVVSPADGTVYDGDRATIRGESIPNAQINVYEDGVLYGSISADSSGKWSFEYITSHSPITLTFQACLNGRCSEKSSKITLYFEGIGVCTIDFRLLNYRFWDVGLQDEVEIDVLLSSGDGVLYIDWGDGKEQERFDHDSTRPSSYRKRYENAGNYNAIARFEQGDCSATRYFSVKTIDQNNSAYFYIAIWFFSLGIATYLLYKYAIISRKK